MSAGDETGSDGARKNRAERRREDTRRKLMRAAYEIIADRGLEGLVIQDITQSADVGYGSFYNHFHSKEAVVDAVIEAALLRILRIKDRVNELAPDAAEAFGVNFRMSLKAIRMDRVWGWFVIRSTLSRGQTLRMGVADSLRRSIERGIESGEFTCDDIEMARHMIGGLLLIGAINLVSPDMPENYEDRLVATALKVLGVSEGKIERVLSRYYPDFHHPPFLEAAEEN
jgi:AcrR family transcriptional regulator